MQYTVVGDNVNVASRLVSLNRTYLTSIAMGKNTHDLVKDRVITRELCPVRLQGRTQSVVVYELIDVAGGLSP